MERQVGNQSCLLLLDPVDLNSLEFILPTLTLAVLNVIVIFGNLLVVAAVWTTAKLRTVTNNFIVSLAVADFLVGVLVLPFSNANEVLRYWVFGTLWCNVWLAVDVWLCTASILNLVAISLDRYLAISRPFRYHDLMTPKRGKILVALVWVISFLICFPPLIGWKEKQAPIEYLHHDNISNISSTTASYNFSEIVSYNISSDLQNITTNMAATDEAEKPIHLDICSLMMNLSHLWFNCTPDMTAGLQDPPCDEVYPACKLTSEPGYIVYSALGSFYIPMCIMAFFYWRIYRTATKTTAALRKGMLTTKADASSFHDDTSVTLRIHRGGGSSSCTSSSLSHSISSRGASIRHNYIDEKNSKNSFCSTPVPRKIRETSLTREMSVVDAHSRGEEDGPSSDWPLLSEEVENGSRSPLSPTSALTSTWQSRALSESCNKSHYSSRSNNGSVEQSLQEHLDDDESKPHLLRIFGRKNIKSHLRRLNKEKKAAKTVGIIVGCFILCWCPFFTIYLIGAFCEDCTPNLVFSIFFWLGYCNSALNPFIYGLFSKDFRFAFKRLLSCNCTCPTEDRKRRVGVWSVIYGIRVSMAANATAAAAAAVSKNSDSNSEE